MYNAEQIANYIIYHLYQRKKNITNQQLQCLLYFVQKKFIEEGRKCFPEEFENWPYIPVIPSIYKKYKVYSGANIPGFIAKEPQEILEEDQCKIDEIIDQYAELSFIQMVKKIEQKN